MALTLLRHTTPDVAAGICYGRTDLELAASFEAEARQVVHTLPGVDRIISSPLRRCASLADFVGQRTGLSPIHDDRLVEMDFGRWEMQAWTDLPRHELDAWAADFLDARPHGGESVAELTARTHSAITDWNAPDQHTLVVTHAGVIKAIFAALGGAHHYRSTISYGGQVTLLEHAERNAPT
ncbi:alpha-ribazole phosphatase [Hyphomonas sp.]|uniref:alpha-ribazole phosphatase n=1 Tax=Hyphomonas sp. TaxID=87 RepID=UPI0025BE17FE|nr:alpha-ribazole phosphatase [Hyphomonas sp.]